METIVVGVRITVLRNVTVRERFKCMFHGKTELHKGTFTYWYPVKDTTYARLVHQLERWYKGKIRVQYGIAGTVEL